MSHQIRKWNFDTKFRATINKSSDDSYINVDIGRSIFATLLMGLPDEDDSPFDAYQKVLQDHLVVGWTQQVEEIPDLAEKSYGKVPISSHLIIDIAAKNLAWMVEGRHRDAQYHNKCLLITIHMIQMYMHLANTNPAGVFTSEVEEVL